MAIKLARFDLRSTKKFGFSRALGLNDGISREHAQTSVACRWLKRRSLRTFSNIEANKVITGPQNLQIRLLQDCKYPRHLAVGRNLGRFSCCRSVISTTRPFIDSRETRKKRLQRSMQTLPNTVKVPADREIENHLRRQKIPFKNGYTSLVAPCPTCKSLNIEEPGIRDNKTWNMYVNKMTGKFICKKCGQSGAWNEIKVV